MEYLTRMLNQLKDDKNFKFHPKCKNLNITHLVFADDLLLFCKGDPYSVNRIYQCVEYFGACSGLEANPAKCSIYYGGVSDETKHEISNSLGFPEGSLPIRYLGLPLIRLGIFSARLWNIATALKILWSIHMNKELLWIKWSHENYLKSSSIWMVKARKGDSWMWKQLLSIRDKCTDMCGGIDNLIQLLSSCCNNSKIKISDIYSRLSPNTPQVAWHDTVWEDLSYPKHQFILWLAVQDKLQTQDRLLRHGIIQNSVCKLCDCSISESRNHLFFECNLSKKVWNGIMEWLNFKWRSCDWHTLLNWFNFRLRGKGMKQKIKRMAFAATVYTIWNERNCRIFNLESKAPDILMKNIKIDVLTIILNSQSSNCREWGFSI
ncbi:uncharacterized protein LOC109831171 [Asparagus officinalis]|uniref:uncharacterized protein LOC109831171 n=1 Tax=Asparagus officinalis TaxID=4686 RepID=UPI00098DF671|nr:uncharacterized protein LOC109831171 [Asparagus officinalis]